MNFGVITPQPLTPERIAAIKSDPKSAKAVKLDLGCKKCPSKLKTYAALEINDELEKEGYVEYKYLSDKFLCECGKTNIDLSIIRGNLHGLLGTQMSSSEEFSFLPIYERSSLKTIRFDFLELLKKNPVEEKIQQFIQKYPILLHQFPADKIYFKPPLLNFFVADFGIITPQKEFILIEIEKPNTKLLKKDGGIAAELNHAFDQINDWFHVIDEHRLAVLDDIGIDKTKISTVRGVVIAGRDREYNTNHLRKLKSRQWARISFLTYDDILYALDSLIENI
ncbi:MAG: Shedu anti-phage system protein SduA domain-containing protein, partial [Candidatus Sifarchaeia archaeon]